MTQDASCSARNVFDMAAWPPSVRNGIVLTQGVRTML